MDNLPIPEADVRTSRNACLSRRLSFFEAAEPLPVLVSSPTALPTPPQQPMFDFDGATYERQLDQIPLNAQLAKVWSAVKSGQWFTLSGLSQVTGCPEASVSARLRDLRKPRFGGFTVERERVKGGRLFLYRVVIGALLAVFLAGFVSAQTSSGVSSLATGEGATSDRPLDATRRPLSGYFSSDLSFWLTTAAAGSMTYADAYTTTHNIRPGGTCPVEGGSPWLYSRQPYAHPAQVYTVMTGLYVASIAVSYELRHHKRTRLFLPVPESYLAYGHAVGFAHNLRVCQ
jgi:hypothetical protein